MPQHQGQPRGPARLNTSVANMARVYNALVGGKDNFEVDREVVRRVTEVTPGMRQTAVEHRAWLNRVVHFLTELRGVQQFLDCGSGLPSGEPPHETAQRRNGEAHVVYVDNDPVVEAHSKVLLEDDERTRFVNADLTRPREVLDHPQVRRHLDFREPVALIHAATLHHLHDTARARAIMAEYVAALAPGSYVAITHMLDPNDGTEVDDLCRDLREKLADNPDNVRHRTYGELAQLLEGTELVPPGWSYLHEWWPAGPRLQPVPESNFAIVGALARKP